MEGVNKVPFKHNSAVVQIKTNIAEHEHISWFPKGYTKDTTVPSQSVNIFGEYDPMYMKESSITTQLAYDFKIPYLKFVDDMVKFSTHVASSITKFDENSKWMSRIYYSKRDEQKVLKIYYYDEKICKWVDGEFKEEREKIEIHIEYKTDFKLVS